MSILKSILQKNKKPHYAAQLLYILSIVYRLQLFASFASVSHVAYNVKEQVLANFGHALWRGSETPKHVLSLLHQWIVTQLVTPRPNRSTSRLLSCPLMQKDMSEGDAVDRLLAF